jgi:hypothetical protein
MGGEYEHSETGNWNLSSPYVEYLAKLFKEADEYKEIAKFGFSDILLDLNTRDIDKAVLRKRGFEKYIYKLKSIIAWSKFAIKEGNQQESFMNYYKDLEMIESECLKNIMKTEYVGMKTRQVINEELFKINFDKVMDIDMNLREPMNKADLIFMHKETFDPHEFKKKVTERFAEGG